MLLRLKHVHRFTDRHGRERYYLRLKGRKATALPGKPGSAEFLAAYHAAIATPAPARSPAAGTLNALVASYYRSNRFTDLRPTTQALYRRQIEHFRAKHGSSLVAEMDEDLIRALLEQFPDRPAASNHLLRNLRLLCAHAVDVKMLRRDPTIGFRRRKYGVKGYRTWTEAEIAQYEAHWPSGSVPRLALAMLLYTGQRRSDVVRIGRMHLSPDGRSIDVRQVKTGRELSIWIHPELAAELAQVPRDQLIFLARPDGTQRTSNGFYNSFVDWCREAGLPPGLAPHGLRKAAARRLAENGSSVHEIAAVTGHKSLQEIAVYTAAAEQAALAKKAMGRLIKLETRKPSRKPSI